MVLDFFGSDGAFYSLDLIGDDDIRDWNGFFTDQFNGVTTVNVVETETGLDNDPDFMDMQIIHLPQDFRDENLLHMKVTDQRQILTHSGILSGVTVEQVPSPALLPGLLGMAVAALRKRKDEAETEA